MIDLLHTFLHPLLLILNFMILSYLMYIFFSFREEQKHLKRASVVIGVIATVIFLLCVAMVAVTLHFTPVMNQLASKYPFLIIDFLKMNYY